VKIDALQMSDALSYQVRIRGQRFVAGPAYTPVPETTSRTSRLWQSAPLRIACRCAPWSVARAGRRKAANSRRAPCGHMAQAGFFFQASADDTGDRLRYFPGVTRDSSWRLA